MEGAALAQASSTMYNTECAFAAAELTAARGEI
jgi:hypothetical protein